jgi:two-component system, sensor histidine kinase
MIYLGDEIMTTALVIDDSRTAADLMVLLLKRFQVEAHAVYGTSQAMKALETEQPNAVFLDINMPGISGFDVLSFMSREPRLMDVPVFIVTGDNQPETINHALAGGARAVLIKPISLAMLGEALKKEGVI